MLNKVFFPFIGIMLILAIAFSGCTGQESKVNQTPVQVDTKTPAPVGEKPVYKIGDIINFAQGGNSANYKVSGWAGQEKNHTWTQGHEAVLHLYIEHIPEDTVLFLEGSPLTGSKLSGQRISLSVNNNEFAEPVTLTEKTNLSLSIPSGSLVKGDNYINLSLPDAISPQELRGTTDKRVLGIAVKSITLKQR